TAPLPSSPKCPAFEFQGFARTRIPPCTHPFFVLQPLLTTNAPGPHPTHKFRLCRRIRTHCDIERTRATHELGIIHRRCAQRLNGTSILQRRPALPHCLPYEKYHTREINVYKIPGNEIPIIYRVSHDATPTIARTCLLESERVHSLYRIQADDAEQFVSVGAVATGTVGLTRCLETGSFLQL
ncbi:hypothetical protein AX14_008224, partial [Amanita brunnescens Koide BX004]